VSQAWLAEVHLVVDDPRQQAAAAQIDDLGIRRRGAGPYAFNPIAGDEYVRLVDSAFIDDTPVDQ
jgi:hypothetical protein